jgi:hypothetical protein
MWPLSNPMKYSSPKSDEEQRKKQLEGIITRFFHAYSALLSSLMIMMLILKSRWVNLSGLLLITMINRFRKNLLRNKIKVFAGDYPALLYPSGSFDPDDPEHGLLRNPILVRVGFILY